jgi:hypothetical protein
VRKPILTAQTGGIDLAAEAIPAVEPVMATVPVAAGRQL